MLLVAACPTTPTHIHLPRTLLLVRVPRYLPSHQASPANSGPYFPVAHVEPFETNSQVLLVDLASNAARADAMARAAVQGMPMASNPVQLIQGETGMLVFHPMYTNSHHHNNMAAGGTAAAAAAVATTAPITSHTDLRVLGFGLVVFRVASLLRATLSPLQNTLAGSIYVRVTDAGADGTQSVLYCNDATTCEGLDSAQPPPLPAAYDDRTLSHTIAFAGRELHLQYIALGPLLGGGSTPVWVYCLVLAGGGIFALVAVAWWVRTSIRHAREIYGTTIEAADRTHMEIIQYGSLPLMPATTPRFSAHQPLPHPHPSPRRYVCHEMRNPLHACMASIHESYISLVNAGQAHICEEDIQFAVRAAEQLARVRDTTPLHPCHPQVAAFATLRTCKWHNRRALLCACCRCWTT